MIALHISKTRYQTLRTLTFMGPCIVNLFFQVYQQDATLYNIIYYWQCSTRFRRFLRPSSGAQNCTHSIGYTSSLLAATASGSSKQAAGRIMTMVNSNGTTGNRIREHNQLRQRVPRVPPQKSVVIHELSWRSTPADSRVFITSNAISSHPRNSQRKYKCASARPIRTDKAIGSVDDAGNYAYRLDHFERSARALVTVQTQRNKTTPWTHGLWHTSTSIKSYSHIKQFKVYRQIKAIYIVAIDTSQWPQ